MSPPLVRCPRCGYDQRGVIDTWQTSCDLQHTCAECGLLIDFRELLSPRMRRPRWCVEFGSGWQFPWRLIATLAMSWGTWKFWTELKMSHDPAWSRVRTYVLALLILLYATFAARHSAEALTMWRRLDAGVPASVSVVVPQSNSPLIGTFMCQASVPWWKAVMQAGAMPWSNTSLGTLAPSAAAMSQINAYGATSTSVLQNHPTPYQLLYKYKRSLGETQWLLAFMGIAAVTCPLMFSALPISRRQAKVRWAHVIRIAAYSAGLLFPIGAIIVWFTPDRSVHTYTAIWIDVDFQIILGQVFVPLMLSLWWGAAAQRYLLMRHPFGIGFSVGLIGLLLSILIDLARRGYLI